MKFIKLIIFQINLLLFLSSVSIASSNFKIIVKVGNEIITSYELENKIKISLFLAQEKLNQNNVNELKKFSLESLINTKLKKEEIKKYNYNKGNEERTSNYFKNIAKKFNTNTENLKKIFLANNLDYNLFYEDIKTEFIWQNLVYEIYSKKISLDEQEIANELNKVILKQKSIIEYNLSEIETKILQKDELLNLTEYINNFSFQKAAQKYSISSTSLDGGNVGWVNSESLSNSMLQLLQNLKIGQYSKPIKKDNSFFIFFLNDKRKISNFDKKNLDELKKKIINTKTNDLLNLYSNNHLSIKRNNTLIDYQ
jgi:peptidyl-prolyl cis-trans isomerase SurA